MITTWDKPYRTQTGVSQLGSCAGLSLAVRTVEGAVTWSVAERYRDGLRELAAGSAESVELAEIASSQAATDIYEQRESQQQAARQNMHMVRCDCGHECPANLRMTTSWGTSCPCCYDRMSE